ncbi:hypothetical protein GGD38_000744 [Chitinophagaceae bacterium OAS944]|nr:hypothetical protein [Chitinophagaceae bacterium OAS944]
MHTLGVFESEIPRIYSIVQISQSKSRVFRNFRQCNIGIPIFAATNFEPFKA